jgi:hypothetical protein
MPAEMDVGCARPTGGPVGESADKETVSEPAGSKEVQPMIQVGKKVPDFVAPAYQQGKCVSVKLSQY